jgi:hypothetical protein
MASSRVFLDVLQPVIFDLDVKSHHIAADRVADLPHAVGIL